MQNKRCQQRLFFMIKPDGLPLEATIREMIEPLVTIIASRTFNPVAVEKIEMLYDMHTHKKFFPYLIEYFKGRPIKAYVLGERGDVNYQKGFFEDFIELVGDTDPAGATPGTIRSLSSDSLEKSMSEGRAVRNLVHRSTTGDETEREAPIFFWDYICDCSKIKGAQGIAGVFLTKVGNGVFYEERLQNSLRKRNLLSPDEELLYYQDLDGQQAPPPKEGRALIKTLSRGSISKREITVTLF